MRIPKKLKILGRTYSIEIRNNRFTKDGASTGATSTAWSQRIWIDNDQNKEGQEECLIHEIIEMILLATDIKLEHSTISTISGVLYQVLKDNNLLKE